MVRLVVQQVRSNGSMCKKKKKVGAVRFANVIVVLHRNILRRVHTHKGQ